MKKLKNKNIESQLDKLQALLESIQEVQLIDSNDPDTWDSDTLYSLVEDLKEALKILEDQKITKKNEFGEVITQWEPGLCSLIDDYQEEEEDD